MGASSVTGKGLGAADHGVKGPHNGRNHFLASISPHVVAAGSVALATGAATVTFPAALENGKANYVVMATALSANGASVSSMTNVSGQFASFDLAGTGTDTVMWVVCTVGN